MKRIRCNSLPEGVLIRFFDGVQMKEILLKGQAYFELRQAVLQCPHQWYYQTLAFEVVDPTATHE